MIRHANILKWAQNNKNGSKGSSRMWMHPPEALQQGHVAYLVKFLGNTEVEQPKGIEIVKEGIRKLKFSQQLRRSEGAKMPKVELTISVDGVAIQEPKTKRIFHQYPLHRISYCADDKSDKKFFSFIAKEADNDKHSCFVFVSDKLSEEITLTIGQAFDLAYRRFLESSGRDLEMRKQMIILQKKVQDLEKENLELRKRLSDTLKNKTNDNFDSLNKQNHNNSSSSSSFTFVKGTTTALDKSLSTNNSTRTVPPIPPRNDLNSSLNPTSPSQELFQSITLTPTVGRKLENLLLNDMDDEFDPRRESPPLPQRPQTNGVSGHNGHFETNGNAKDLFGAEPFSPQNNNINKQVSEDPFGMGDFNNTADLEVAIGDIDKKLSEMRDGFSRGISFGNDDFSLDTLDPLVSKTNN